MQGPFTGLSWRVPTLERISTYLLRGQHIVESGAIDICWALRLGSALRDRCPCMAVTFEAAADGDNVHPQRLIRPCKLSSVEVPMNTDTATRSDLDALTALNRDYIHSVQHGDVQRFDEILAEDFLCSNPDGSLVDKKQFLAQTARPVTISGLTAGDVKVRILGDVAIIHARTSYTTADGEQRNGRYTDVWARRDGKWRAVSAHVTR